MTAAIAHLAHSTPPRYKHTPLVLESRRMIARLTRSFCLSRPAYCAACRFLFATTDFNSYVAHTHATPLLSAYYLTDYAPLPSLSVAAT